MTARVLVAGVGNIFLGDDGFGVEVARRLAAHTLPDGVEVADFGIRGVHLAFQLLDGYDRLILVDAAPRGEQPGTLSVIAPDLSGGGGRENAGIVDAHGMEPDSMLALLGELGGQVGEVLVVGCEPADVQEAMGLSEPVEAAVDDAVRLVCELVGAAVTTRGEG
ncbi:hydrogenase maturation protease [soil metagenome]